MSAWHTRFKEKLAIGGEPVFILDFQSQDMLRTDHLTDFRYALYSDWAPDLSGHIPHAIKSIASTGQRVNVRSWTSSMGGMRVELASADIAQFVSMAIPRGSIAELRVGFAGFPFEYFEPCGVYVFKDLSGSRNNWSMDFIDAFTAMQTPDKVALSGQFYKSAGTNKVRVTAFYDASDTSSTQVVPISAVTDGSVTVDDAYMEANYPRDTSSGARGLLYCEPSSGDPFFLKFTDIQAGQVTVVNTNVLGTTRSDLGATDPMTVYGYVHDSPPDVAQMILFGGLAGSSTMPNLWHMDINYSSRSVNRSDFNIWRARWLSSYTDFNGDFIQSQPIQNAFRALEEYLSSFGAWLVFKEGGLSWRFVQDMRRPGIAEYVITDSDIVSEDGYSLHNQDAPVEYYQIGFPNAFATDGGKLSTRPAEFRLDHSSKDKVFNDDVSTSNKVHAYQNLSARLTQWYTRIPDELRLTLKGWRYAELVPGDVVSIESNYLYDMTNGLDIISITEGGIDRHHRGTQYLVTGVDVNWSSFSVSVQLSTFPNHT
tara:strand:- start:56 stop:1672 length:1617 start_codon:yes stop_codon:yes gene_type:complete